MDVGGWLRGLGLGQYETNFRDNKIDADLLPRLSNDDLKDIGVSALGDRRRLLDAIAALAGAKSPPDVPAFPSKPAQPKDPQVSAERRPITVMFCDLVGSTSLAAKLDPEDWRNLVNAYRSKHTTFGERNQRNPPHQGSDVNVNRSSSQMVHWRRKASSSSSLTERSADTRSASSATLPYLF